MTIMSPVIAALMIAAAAAAAPAQDPVPDSFLAATMNSIDGKPYPMSQLKGQVVLLVNVASKCGNTPQYAGLEAMYEKYKGSGLVVLGVPANNFGKQEPGTNDEIKQFCTATYNVKFPMLAKVSVKGDDICPLYSYLTTKSPKPGDITWNFAKFLISRTGVVIDRFDPKQKPDDPKLVASVEAALAAK